MLHCRIAFLTWFSPDVFEIGYFVLNELKSFFFFFFQDYFLYVDADNCERDVVTGPVMVRKKTWYARLI